MSQIQEVRSQLGMALSSATGFNNAAMSMAGAPNLGGSGFGHTFTNAAMAYSPHYGAIQAQTTLQQEWQVQRYGLAAAQQMAPPGVAPASFAMAAMSNAIDRDVSAKQEAASAARATFWTGAGGLAAGDAAAGLAGAPIGALVGGAIGKRFFGAGAVGAGRMLGGLAGSFAAFDLAQNWAGDKIEKHFSEVEQIGGFTRELGELAGGGRGLSRAKRYDLGVAARGAAGDLKMDVQQMGDILALGRESGMMPSSTDPGKAREQYKDFARAIEEGAQVLQTSLAGATQVIKQAAQQGMSATQGITQAAGAGGADVWLQQQARMNAFGSAGASAARGMGFSGAQGRGVYMGGFGAAGSAGLSGEELKIMGGRFGAAGFVGQTQMAMAASPTGDMQLMAAMGGHSGGDMLGMAGAAIDGIMGGGGDFLSNMGKFMVHKNEYRRGIGAKGIQTMAGEQLRMGGEMIQQFMPDMSSNEAARMFGISMGLDPDQAKLLAGGGRRGGGRGRGRSMGASRIAKAAVAMGNSNLGVAGPLSEAEIQSQVEGAPSGFGFGEAITGGVTGALLGGGPIGAIAGAGIGFVSENYSALENTFGGGPSLWADPEEKADYYQRKAATEYDDRMAVAKKSAGIIDTNEEEVKRFMNTDLSLARIDLDAEGSFTGSQMTAGMLKAAGLETVRAGAGTMKVAGDYYRSSEVQKVAGNLGTGVSKKQATLGKRAAFEASTSTDRIFSNIRTGKTTAMNFDKTGMDFFISRKEEVYSTPNEYRQGLIGAIKDLKSGNDPKEAGDKFAKLARAAAKVSGNKEALRAIQEEGLTGGTAISFVAAFTGEKTEDLREAISATAARGGGASFEGAREATIDRGEGFLSKLVGEDVAGASQSDRTYGLMLGKLTRGYNQLPLDQAGDLLTSYWAHKGQKDFQSEFDSYGLDEMYEDASTKSKKERRSGTSIRRTSFSKKITTAVRDSGLGARILDAGGDAKLRMANQKEFQGIYQDAYLEDIKRNGESNLKREAPELYEKRYDIERMAAAGLVNGLSSLARGDGVSGAIEKAKEAVLTKGFTTLAAEVADDTNRHDRDAETGKPKRRGPRPISKTAGFTEMESNMNTINKSLRHSERMHKMTHRKMQKLLEKQ